VIDVPANPPINLTRFTRRLPARRYPTFNCCDPYCLGIKASHIDHRKDEHFKMKSTTGYLNYSC